MGKLDDFHNWPMSHASPKREIFCKTLAKQAFYTIPGSLFYHKDLVFVDKYLKHMNQKHIGENFDFSGEDRKIRSKKDQGKVQ